MARLRRAFYLMVVDRAWFVTPPCFWCCFMLNYATHYTMLFDICQILNEINRGYLPQKGTKGLEVFFYRIYGLIPSAGSGQAGFGRWRALRGSCFATP